MSEGLKHTPGPWRWEFNATSKTLQLCGGIPKFDKTVMDFARWGMGGASPRFNGKHAGDDHNILFRPSERQDWMVPFLGREHHASWLMDITHPDAQLIASAPDLAKRVHELEEELAKHVAYAASSVDEQDEELLENLRNANAHKYPGIADDLMESAADRIYELEEANSKLAKDLDHALELKEDLIRAFAKRCAETDTQRDELLDALKSTLTILLPCETISNFCEITHQWFDDPVETITEEEAIAKAKAAIAKAEGREV